MKQPFKNYYPISQRFGQNLNGYYKADGLKGHQGIDFAMPTGTPIYAIFTGTVSGVSTDIQKGEGVSIMSDDVFQWNGKPCKFICVCWHFKDKSISLKVGDKVKVGQQIGLSNNTGQSTGAHLHLSLIPIATDGSRNPLAGYNNGYHGCIDPLLYLELESSPKETKIKELQRLLNKWGAKLKEDGSWGKLSNNALLDFLK